MRIKHTVNPVISDDTAGKNVLFGFDGTAAEVQIDSYSRMVGGKLSITAAGTEAIPTGDVDAIKGCYLIFSASCTISINGSLDTIDIVMASDATEAKFFIEASLSSISVTAGAADLVGTYCLWGDVVS